PLPSYGYDRRRAHVSLRWAQSPDDVGIASACAGGGGGHLSGRWLPSFDSARDDRPPAVSSPPHVPNAPGPAGGRVIAVSEKTFSIPTKPSSSASSNGTTSSTRSRRPLPTRISSPCLIIIA